VTCPPSLLHKGTELLKRCQEIDCVKCFVVSFTSSITAHGW